MREWKFKKKEILRVQIAKNNSLDVKLDTKFSIEEILRIFDVKNKK